MSTHDHKNLMRISESQRDSLLDRLDRQSRLDDSSREGPGVNRREDQRFCFRIPNLLVTVEHPAGGVVRLIVTARNISRGGIGFLHGGFLYPGSSVKVVLKKLDSEPQVLSGEIVSCRHVEGSVHEIGVRFEQRIDPHQFTQPEQEEVVDETKAQQLEELRGRVLHVEDSTIDQRLMAHYMKATGVEFIGVSTPGAAIDIIKQRPIDIVICDINFEDIDGAEMIENLRKNGFQGPVIAVTAETDGQRLDAARQAGAEHVLFKPFKPGDLYDLLSEVHREIGAIYDNETLFSSFDATSEMKDLVVEYIEQVKRTAHRLEKAVSSDDFDAARQMCIDLKGSAPSYGFSPLGEVAIEAIEMLEATRAVSESATMLRRLGNMCNNLALREKMV